MPAADQTLHHTYCSISNFALGLLVYTVDVSEMAGQLHAFIKCYIKLVNV